MEQIFARSTSSNSLISCQNRIMISSSLISEYWLIWLIFEQRRISENPLKYNWSHSITVRLLEPGPFEEDYPVTKILNIFFFDKRTN